MNLDALFPDEDYRFSMRMFRRPIAEFLRPSPEYCALLAQRRHWLTSAPRQHARLLPEGESELNEVIQLVRALEVLPPGAFDRFAESQSPLKRCIELGKILEPDFLLLKSVGGGAFRLCGGCVCFPSSWSLSSHIGRSIGGIHEIVPGLNGALGNQIDRFLANLRSGVSWERYNWGISRSPQLNQHPARKVPGLGPSVGLDEVWLRIEHQAFMALPNHAGVLFAIRIVVHEFPTIGDQPVIRAALARALRTMPEDVARYKGLLGARVRLLELLQAPSLEKKRVS